MAFVEVSQVGKSFTGRNGQSFEALRGVDLSVEEGEFVSLIGHSGCGKSTVLNLIAGLLPVSTGRILVGGAEVDGPGPDRMVAFQNHSLLPWLTLRQNIRLAVDQVHGSLSRAERIGRVEDALAMVKLMPAADRLPEQVSGGMKQRCGIARALCVEPKILLLDEPFGALDALTRANLQDQLIQIWEQNRITVVMITHDVDEALLLSDRIVMMSNGPAAQVSDVMTVDIPRPRDRLKAVDHPSYYRQRGELIYFLNKCKKAKTGGSSPAKAPRVPGFIDRGLEKPDLQVGYVPLADAAPFAIADAEGYFAEQGLSVSLNREPSWKAIADGMRERRLDAAQMVVGMPLSLSLGLGGKKPLEVCASMTLSRGGNAITLGSELEERGVTDRESLREYLKKREVAPFFGMVHPASMHNLLFRAWLADGGIEPDKDMKLVVIPPPQMVASLRRGSIVGYCVGEPWNVRAVSEGLGRVCATDADIWPDHPEKVLGVTRVWAEQYPKTHEALLKALLKACAKADDPQYRKEKLPELLSERRYVGGQREFFDTTYNGPYTYGPDDERELERFVSFSRDSANLVRKSEMHWVLAQMARWGLVEYPGDAGDVIASVMNEHALRNAAHELELGLAEETDPPILFGSEPAFSSERARSYLREIPISHELRLVQDSSPINKAPSEVSV